MKAGKLRHRVTIQKYTDTQDPENGEMTKTWTSFKSVWAQITPLQGKERYEAQQISAEVSHKIRIRYVSGITSTMRIKYGTRIFEIDAPPININERNKELEILCIEKV